MDTIKINPLVVSVGPASDSAIFPIIPTEHGGGTKKVLAVAASLIIPVAAPWITSAIATSGALGATVASFAGHAVGKYVTSAIVGAAMGAVTASVTGQNVKAGAITGALGGMAGQWGANKVSAAGADAGAASGNLATSGDAAASVNQSYQGAQNFAASNRPPMEISTSTVSNTSGNFLSNIADKFGITAANAADVAVQAGAQLLGAQLVPDPGSPLEDPQYQAHIEAYKKELEILRDTNKELFDQRMQVAQDFLINARGYDPSYFADLNAKRTLLQQAAIVQSQEEESIFSGRGGLSSVDKLRAALDAGLNVGQSYIAGKGKGLDYQNQLMTAGLNAMPNTGWNASILEAEGRLADKYAGLYGQERDRKDDQRTQITKLGAKLFPGKPEEDDELKNKVGLLWDVYKDKALS